MKMLLISVLSRLVGKSHYAIYKGSNLVVYFDDKKHIPDQYKKEEYKIKRLVEL